MKKGAKRIAIGIAGGLVLALGVVMLVLPGPAFIVIPAGFAILATEFDWAQKWCDRCRDKMHEWREGHKKRKMARQVQRAGG